MNKDAIKNAADFVERIAGPLQRKLENNSVKQPFEKIYIARQIGLRRQRSFHDQDKNSELVYHIRGMVYGMLSSGFRWKQIEEYIDFDTGRIGKLDCIFHNYDPEWLLSKDADPNGIVAKFREYKWLGQGGEKQRLAQINGLIHTNIQNLKRFQEECGSIDVYYRQFIAKDPSFKSLIKNLSDPGKDKFVQIGRSLAAEYLRNVGYNISKPDRHICRILDTDHLGCLDISVAEATTTKIEEAKFEAMEIVKQITLDCNKRRHKCRSVAEVDYILWSYCADGYGDICTEKRPMCWVCPASGPMSGTEKIFCKKARQDKEKWKDAWKEVKS